MSSAGQTEPPAFSPSVFLSYASEDRAAARMIRDALVEGGIDVWYDESELGGGDAWDAKIKKQIRDCVYFMPIISARTEARHEGYFRREWRLAVDRTHDMADDILFLTPIVIDSTDQYTARVPEKFLTVQWLKLPGGTPTPALQALCKRMVAGRVITQPVARRPAAAPVAPAGKTEAPPPPLPEFPHEEPGKKVKFYAMVVVWACHMVWGTFKRLPRFLRGIIIFCLVMSLLSKSCSSNSSSSNPTRVHTSTQHGLTAAQQAQVDATLKKLEGVGSASELAKAGSEIAKEVIKQVGDTPASKTAVLAIPFMAPADDADGTKFAMSVFAQVVNRLSADHPGEIGISTDPLTGIDISESAKTRGKEQHSGHVVFGAIEGTGTNRTLMVKVIDLSEEDNNWSQSYPLATADPKKIASEVGTRLSDLSD